MKSLRAALAAYEKPGQPVSLMSIVSTLSFHIPRPISVTRLIALLARGGPLAKLGGKYATVVNQLDWSSDDLVGFLDLHTHPAAHLGYGTQLFYGPPDGDPSQVFNDCNLYHGG
jgi:hypothetical protein